MEPSTIFTRKKFGLDNNVWLAMLLCVLLSGGLLGYTVSKSKEEKDCKTIEVMVNDKGNLAETSFLAGQTLTFRCAISPGDQLIWDFGDSAQKEGSAAVHIFSKPGKYLVVATLNGKCPYYTNIKIDPVRQIATDTSGNILEDIISKDNALTGETISFSTSRKATTYLWYIENHRNFPEKHTKDMTYKFSRQDSYTVVLVLDNDNSKKYSKVVEVASPTDPKLEEEIPKQLIPKEIPQPVQPEVVKPVDTVATPHEPVKKKTKYVTDEILMSYIQSLVCKEMTPAQFDDYFCLGVATPVIVNDKERKAFSDFSADIQAKRIKIESVKATREGDCVVNIKVNYDKNGFLEEIHAETDDGV